MGELTPLSTDTIVALSTAPGVGAIGIVRLSGPDAARLADQVVRPAKGGRLSEGPSHQLRYAQAFDPVTGHPVDEVLAAVMSPPGTYTREEVVEIHCHGGPAAQRAVLRVLTNVGARLAEPGEFTRRAFLNGRIDLAQAESVASIVQARSASALRAAVRQLEGGLGGTLRALRGRLVGVLASLEAGIDFSDEDIDDVDRGAAAEALRLVADELRALLDTAFLGRALREGVRTAIVGPPNVGKSSLLNALAMRERAIVSEIPGTTRDTVEEMIEVGGIPLHLVDTAGLRESDDHVERLGIERSRRALAEADLVLAVFDVSAPVGAAAPAVLDRILVGEVDPARTILVGNKLDLAVGAHGEWPSWEERLDALSQATERWTVCAVSALTGVGLDELRLAIERLVAGDGGFHLEEPLLATERQRVAVEEALAAVDAAREGLVVGVGDELICEDVRRGAAALGSVTGDVDLVQEVLDDVFSRFCIGK